MSEKIIRILLVEDDQTHVDLIRRAFESHAAEVNLIAVGSRLSVGNVLGHGGLE